VTVVNRTDERIDSGIERYVADREKILDL